MAIRIEWLPFLVRPLIALLTHTFFQPDEYFQALEPAHHIVFGYGHLTWEWTASPPIRSIAYPALFVPVYWLLKVLALDDTFLEIAAPKVVAGIFAAFTDYYTFKLASRFLGSRYASTALLLSLTSFFHALSLSRTLSNSLETSLTAAVLFYWPFPGESSQRSVRVALTLAGIACLIRPTSAVQWAFLGVGLLLRTPREQCLTLINNVFVIGFIFSGLLFLIDSTYNGQPTFTPFNFLRTNLSSISLFYGANSFHYYVSQALPILCTTTLPFVIHGVYRSLQIPGSGLHSLIGLSIWTIGIYSLNGHKEWRFIHPILPVLNIFAAKSLVDLFDGNPSNKNRKPPRVPVARMHLALVLLSLPATFYVMFFHGRGQISVMHHLRSIKSANLHSVGFFMPCHSTPSHAYLHRIGVEVWSIGCEPPLGLTELSEYKDQTRIFYDSPSQYLQQRFPSVVDPAFPRSPYPSNPPGNCSNSVEWKHTWPSHFVIFGALVDNSTFEGRSVRAILDSKGYYEAWMDGNGYEEDERKRGGVRLWAYSAVG